MHHMTTGTAMPNCSAVLFFAPTGGTWLPGGHTLSWGRSNALSVIPGQVVRGLDNFLGLWSCSPKKQTVITREGTNHKGKTIMACHTHNFSPLPVSNLSSQLVLPCSTAHTSHTKRLLGRQRRVQYQATHCSATHMCTTNALVTVRPAHRLHIVLAAHCGEQNAAGPHV